MFHHKQMNGDVDSDASSSDDDNGHVDRQNEGYSDSSDENNVFPLDATNVKKIPSIEKDLALQKRLSSIDLYQSMYQHSLRNKKTRQQIQFEGYRLMDEDIKDKFFHCNLKNEKNGQPLTRVYYSENFKAVYKDIQIVKTTDIRTPVITTVY